MRTVFIAPYASPLGAMTMASDGDSLIGLYFDGQRFDRRNLAADRMLVRDDLSVFDETRRWLDRYFAGGSPGKTPAVSLEGTPFQREVWELLCGIPYGTVTTYGALAAELSDRMAPLAVGGAVGRNPVSLIVPCHRVVPASGGIGAYGGGVERKRALLALEQGKTPYWTTPCKHS